jgi:hypothetical protein
MQQWDLSRAEKERCVDGTLLEDNKAAVAAQAEVGGGSGSVGRNESDRGICGWKM